MAGGGDRSTERARRAARLPAILLIAAGIALLAAAVSFGKGGPSINDLQFAVDSSGTGPAPSPPAPAQPVDRTPPQLIADPPAGFMRTLNKTPTFEFSSSEPNSIFFCKLGDRPARPCTSPFRVPDLGYGRHVLWVMTADTAGNGSPGVKFKYLVRKPRR
jgi:hypothetical protein